MGASQIPLAGGWIDRDVSTRSSAAKLEQAWADPDTKVLRLNGVQVPITGEGTARRLSLLASSTVVAAEQERLYLGRRDGTPVFAVAAADTANVAAEEWAHPFEVALQLSPAERELIVMASALIRWHESAGYSAREGTPTEVTDGGWSRIDSRGGELFPRTDPAIIVLIEHEDRVLLGSNTLWESGRFSLLAGFVEAGETLERAVEREVFEEAGVRLDHIQYAGSQPWPFPQSLMIGFRARLAQGQDPDRLTPDPSEISEVRWFSREEIADPPTGIRLPTRLSIAGWLLQEWLSESAQ